MRKSVGAPFRRCGTTALGVLVAMAFGLTACGQPQRQAKQEIPTAIPQQGAGSAESGGGGLQQGTIQGWDRGGSRQDTLTGALKGEDCAAVAVNLAPEGCQCVTFVVYELFKGPLGGGPTAESMADKSYWNREEAGWRYRLTRKDSIRPGDVIIMQHDATVYPWNVKAGKWDCSFRKIRSGGIGWGAGHIGIVQTAEYWPEQHGWYISMMNANWPPEWGDGYQTRQYANEGTGEQITCATVQLSEVFVPDGSKVSFWRAN